MFKQLTGTYQRIIDERNELNINYGILNGILNIHGTLNIHLYPLRCSKVKTLSNYVFKQAENIYPIIYKRRQMFETLPVSIETGERSFSAFGPLKTF